MEKNIKVIVAAHKKYQMPENEMYIPVQVGAEGKEKIEGYTQDNTGDNISSKNPYFCELTGLYWAWKNLDADYKGLVHYRRYFTKAKRIPKKEDEKFKIVLTKKEAELLVDTVFNTITRSVVEGDKVLISGFGTFKVNDRKARKGISPKTQEEMIIPASKTVTFKPSNRLKDAMN